MIEFEKLQQKLNKQLARDRQIQEKYGVKSDLIMKMEDLAKHHVNKG